MSNALVNYQPQSLPDLVKFSEMLAKSGIVPQQYRGKPNDVLAACLWGWETGELPPMIALSCIDVIQGRAAYRAEALAGIALKRGLIQDIEESFEGEPGADDFRAVCVVTKANGKRVRAEFSLAEAKKAGLTGKDNWGKWLKRMLRARARGFAVRDAAPHSFLGYSAEEVRSFGPAEEDNVGPERARDVTPRAEPPAAPALDHDPLTGEVVEAGPEAGGKLSPDDPDPLKIMPLALKDAVETLTRWLEDRPTKAEAAAAWWRYRPQFEAKGNGWQRAATSIEGWLAEWSEPTPADGRQGPADLAEDLAARDQGGLEV